MAGVVVRLEVVSSPIGFQAPTVIEWAGENAKRRFLEFFVATIRNPNTRKAYFNAAAGFFDWCESLGFALPSLSPMIASTYIEKLTRERSAPTVKQHLAALRMLFDWLVTGQVIGTNPFWSVRGPKYSTTKGKTPVLYADDARALFEAIDTSHVVGLRDRAMIGLMIYSFARIGAVVGMQVKDYYVQGRRAWFRLHEKGGRYLQVPAHHKAAEFLDAYLEGAGIAEEKDSPLFRTARGRIRELTGRGLVAREALAMVKRRAIAAGLPADICNHSFRATGITDFLANGGTLEAAARIAGHASTKTTQLYNRTADTIELTDIERIRI